MVSSRSTTRWRSAPLALVLTLLLATPASAANLCDPTVGTQCAKVNTEGAIHTVRGKSEVASYIVSISNAAITAALPAISLEAEAARGLRINEICLTPGSATAAAWTQWQLIRTTGVSSAGTVIAAEVTTGNNGLAKMDPADANWSGVARTLGTGGTAGAILDTGNIFLNITATPPTMNPQVCRRYCNDAEKCPRVLAGVTNGIKLQWVGVAGGASASVSISFVAD